ncbi:MAG: hypothetical protein ACYSTL_03230, partial [Planctomycetota bacterium]
MKINNSLILPKRRALAALLGVLLIAVLPASASPIADISTETVQGSRSAPPYAWNYAFDIGFSNYEVDVEVIIVLQDYPQSNTTLLSTWESGIESMWSRQFDIVDGSFRYHVNFDATFHHFFYGGHYHHQVEVCEGQGTGNMIVWYETCDWGEAYNGEFAAHEVGHMFSLYDEYVDGAQDPANPIVDDSIMGSLDGAAEERHYEPFLDWLQSHEPEREL